MKAIKRITALLLGIAVCLSILTACGAGYKKNAFFPDELLATNMLSDMPVPPHTEDAVMQYDNILYLTLDKEEYLRYVGELVAYLLIKEDVYHIGYSVGSHLEAEMFPYNVIAPLGEGYERADSDHTFFFAVEEGLVGRNANRLSSPVQISVIREYDLLSYDGRDYNTAISVYSGYQAAAEWDPCAAEHTYGEGVEYKIPASTDTVLEYTCIHCGNTELSSFIGDMKTYSVTVADTEGKQYLTKWQQSVISGVICTVEARAVSGIELKITVNGTEIPARLTEGGTVYYAFIMPTADIVITAEATEAQ